MPIDKLVAVVMIYEPPKTISSGDGNEGEKARN